MSNPFKKGQKVYRLNRYYHGKVEIWTFIRKETERNGGGWILYDERNSYRTMFNIDEFSDDKDQVELNYYQKALEHIKDEKKEWYEDLSEAKDRIFNCEHEINNCNKRIDNLVEKYGHLHEKYPEEFI